MDVVAIVFSCLVADVVGIVFSCLVADVVSVLMYVGYRFNLNLQGRLSQVVENQVIGLV
jgi:hypothetical protein